MKEESQIFFSDSDDATHYQENTSPNATDKEILSSNTGSLRELLGTKEELSAQRQPVYGVVIGELIELYRNSALIKIPDYHPIDVEAKIICAYDFLKDRKKVAIMFEGGDVNKPMIIGMMEDQTSSHEVKSVTVDHNEHLLIEANQEIELRCGESSIVLTQDGRILLRGNYISSQAMATQRIRGGSVQIN